MEAEINVKSDNNIIQLKESKDILRLKIKDEEGNDTGNFLEFNLGDLDYLLILYSLLSTFTYCGLFNYIISFFFVRIFFHYVFLYIFCLYF